MTGLGFVGICCASCRRCVCVKHGCSLVTSLCLPSEHPLDTGYSKTASVPLCTASFLTVSSATHSSVDSNWSAVQYSAEMVSASSAASGHDMVQSDEKDSMIPSDLSKCLDYSVCSSFHMSVTGLTTNGK